MYLCKEEELCKDPERMGWKPEIIWMKWKSHGENTNYIRKKTKVIFFLNALFLFLLIEGVDIYRRKYYIMVMWNGFHKVKNRRKGKIEDV